jgi:hypothetical protein
MSRELEDRLERVADTLPTSTADSRDRARHAALATFRRPRRRRRAAILLIPAVLAVVAATAAILAAPWGDGPLATERALAVLGDQPVVHAIIEQPGPGGAVIDLESGEERPTEGQRTEYWYDDARDYLRARVSVGGRHLPGGAYLHTPEGFFTDVGVWRGPPPSVDPALEGFASGYREALESGDARVVGQEIVDGRNALILRFPLPSDDPSSIKVSQEVAVDRNTYRPLRLRLSSPDFPRKIPWSAATRIVLIETIPRAPGDFQRPEAGEPRPEKQTSALAGTVTPAQAATALGRSVFWPGRGVQEVELTKIQLMGLTTEWTDGHTTHGQSLAFQYGADLRTAHLEGRRSLIMTQATSAKESLRFGPLDPEPKAGELHLIGFSSPSRSDVAMWHGAMQRDGVYISFESPERDLIVAAAKSLVPLG